MHLSEKQVDAKEEKDRPFDGWRVPASGKARELTRQAVRLIDDHEHRHRLKLARSRRNQESFEATVAAIVADLLHNHLSGSSGAIAITLDKSKLARRSRYRPAALGKTLPHVLMVMAELGIADMTKGWHDLKPRPDRERYRQTTMRAGRWLRERIQDVGLGFADLGRDNNEELIILRGTKRPRKGGTLKADLEEYTDSGLTMRLRQEMRAVNAWLAPAHLSADAFPHIDTTDRRLRRAFNNGRFDHGGRFSGGWWMNLPKAIRREHLRINGKRVASLDYDALYPRLAYAHVGAVPPMGDLYGCIPGHRKGAKVLFNSLLFDGWRTPGKPRTRKPKGTIELLPQGVAVGELIAAIERAHPAIAELFGRGIGFELMHTESTIMVRVLLRLRDLGIVALPVHDALIVASSDADAAAREMAAAAEQIVGCRLQVTIDEK